MAGEALLPRQVRVVTNVPACHLRCVAIVAEEPLECSALLKVAPLPRTSGHANGNCLPPLSGTGMRNTGLPLALPERSPSMSARHNGKYPKPAYPPPPLRDLAPVLDRNIEALRQRPLREESASSVKDRIESRDLAAACFSSTFISRCVAIFRCRRPKSPH